MRVFVYGELCKPEVLRATLARVPIAELAMLPDYRRTRDEPGGYFRAVPAAGAVVVGLLLDGIEDDDLEALDAFENVQAGEYRRAEVGVERSVCGRGATAWVYL